MRWIFAANLPSGSTVQIVAGPVDYTGIDPATGVLDTVAAAEFGADGTVSRTIDTSSSVFVRSQVRDAGGTVIGVGNPLWLLREPPPNGIPVPRQV